MGRRSGRLVKILERAESQDRAAIYDELELKLFYYPGDHDRSLLPRVKATADLRVSAVVSEDRLRRQEDRLRELPDVMTWIAGAMCRCEGT